MYRWLINLDKKQRVGCLDNFWLEVMLCLIGETFDDHSKYVNGAVVSVRNKGDKIGMWLGDASQQSSIMTIGKMVKERLGIDARVRKYCTPYRSIGMTNNHPYETYLV